MEEIEQFLQRWGLRVFEDKRKELMESIFTNSEWRNFVETFVDLYVLCIFKYLDFLGFSSGKQARDSESPASGLVFFLWSFVFVLHFPDWIQRLPDLLHYNLLYLFVDHYIDDTSMSKEKKKSSIVQMFLLLENPKQRLTLPLVDPVLYHISKIYEKIISRHSRSQARLAQIFKTQIEGLRYQNDSKTSRETLEDICSRKGSQTMEVIASFLEVEDAQILEEAQNIGAIMQFIDDCIDIENDLENNLTTIATKIYQEDGILDSLLKVIVEKIDKINNRFWIFKVAYTLFLCYIPDRWSKYFSKETVALFHKYNIFDYNLGCDGVKLLTSFVLERIRINEIKIKI